MCCFCTPDPYHTHVSVTPAPVVVVRPSFWDRPFFARMPRPMFPTLPRWNHSPVIQPVVVGHHGIGRFSAVPHTATVAGRVIPGQASGFHHAAPFAHRAAAPAFAGRVVVGR